MNKVYIKTDKDLLITLTEHCNRIEKYVKNIKVTKLSDDDMFFDAINMNIAQIGEVANKCSKNFKESHESIPWKQIIEMRNFIVHEYGAIDKSKILNTIERDIPILKNS